VPPNSTIAQSRNPSFSAAILLSTMPGCESFPAISADCCSALHAVLALQGAHIEFHLRAYVQSAARDELRRQQRIEPQHYDRRRWQAFLRSHDDPSEISRIAY